jgi:transcriptional regulator with XRE-family HTH domain
MPRTLPRSVDQPDPQAGDIAALGRLVRNRRAQSQMRIDDAASLLGVSKDVLSRLENGRSVSLDKVFVILDGLGLTLFVFDRKDASAVRRKLGPSLSEPA